MPLSESSPDHEGFFREAAPRRYLDLIVSPGKPTPSRPLPGPVSPYQGSFRTAEGWDTTAFDRSDLGMPASA